MAHRVHTKPFSFYAPVWFHRAIHRIVFFCRFFFWLTFFVAHTAWASRTAQIFLYIPRCVCVFLFRYEETCFAHAFATSCSVVYLLKRFFVSLSFSVIRIFYFLRIAQFFVWHRTKFKRCAHIHASSSITKRAFVSRNIVQSKKKTFSQANQHMSASLSIHDSHRRFSFTGVCVCLRGFFLIRVLYIVAVYDFEALQSILAYDLNQSSSFHLNDNNGFFPAVQSFDD